MIADDSSNTWSNNGLEAAIWNQVTKIILGKALLTFTGLGEKAYTFIATVTNKQFNTCVD